MELDIEQFDLLRDYLVAKGHIASDEKVSLTALAGGVSNRTVKITWSDGHGWVLKQALEKLRVEVDWFSSPARIAVEARALRWLNDFAPGSTPGFVFEDSQNHLLAMEAIREPHDNWKSLLLAGQVVPGHFQQFAALLGRVHGKSRENAAAVQKQFGDRTYFVTLRLEPYYLYTAQMVPEAAGFLKELADDTAFHREALVHGDFSPKNVLIHDGRLTLLDHEVAHFGEPAFDVGFAMAHFLSKAHHLPKSRNNLAEAAMLFITAYRDELPAVWATELEPRWTRHTQGCLLARVAGKSQLEYLTGQEKERQKKIVLRLIAGRPATMLDLIAQFIQAVEGACEN